MTIQGAIAELQNLLEVDDVPIYYKSGIEKVIETITMEFAGSKVKPQVERKDDDCPTREAEGDWICTSCLNTDCPWK